MKVNYLKWPVLKQENMLIWSQSCVRSVSEHELYNVALHGFDLGISESFEKIFDEKPVRFTGAIERKPIHQFVGFVFEVGRVQLYDVGRLEAAWLFDVVEVAWRKTRKFCDAFLQTLELQNCRRHFAVGHRWHLKFSK